MLRLLVLLLVLANLAFYSWTQGWLDDVVGVRAAGPREPERLARQVRPDLVSIQPLGKDGAARPEPRAEEAKFEARPETKADTKAEARAEPVAAKPVCLEAGPFAAGETRAAEVALRAVLPVGGWTSQTQARPGLWMVYLGRFPDRAALQKRQDELRAMKVEYDELRSPSDLAPGLSLGRFEERGNANNALEKFALRGIRGARIIEVRAPAQQTMLRVEQADAETAAKLTGLSAPSLGKGFAPCQK